MVRFLLALLLLPLLALTWLGMTESGLRWGYQQAGTYLPGELRLTKLQGRLLGTINVTGLEYQQDGTIIRADQLTLAWQPLALLAANINITSLQLQALKIVVPKSEQADQPQPLSLPEINLPWRMALNNISVDGLNIIQGEQNINLQQIQLSATTLFSRIDIDQLNIVGDDFSLNITGELHPVQDYRHKLEVQWQLALASKALLKGGGELAGDTKRTHLNQQLSGPLQLTLKAELSDLLERFKWQANVRVTEFDTTKINPAWPALNGEATLDARGDLSTASLVANMQADHADAGAFDADIRLQRLSDNSIQIEHLLLHSRVNDSRIRGRGQWQPGGETGSETGDVAMALDWQNLSWPLSGDVWFENAIGSGWLKGNINQYQLALAGDQTIPQAPALTLYASASGNLDGLDFDSLRLTTLDGEVMAKGKLGWAPQLVWQADLSARDINPASFQPDWPGQLGATISSHGGMENGQLIGRIDIHELSGQLRGHSVSLRSGFDWRDNGLEIDHFNFHSGTSQLSAQGRIDESLNLDIAIDANDLAELYPKAKGQLKAEATLSGPLKSPKIVSRVTATGLHLPDYQMASLDADIAVDLFSWQQVDIKLAAQSLRFKDYALQSLAINANSQQLEIKAIAKALTTEVKLVGEFVDKTWQGRIEQADIKSQRFANWQLRQSSTLVISEKTLLVDELCWLSSQQASLCAAIKHKDESWQSQLTTTQLPLVLLSPFLPADLELEGLANATAELEFQAPDQLMGQAKIDLPAGAVSYPLMIGERDRWQYQSGAAVIVLNEQGLEANAQISINNDDQFKVQLALPGASLLALDQNNQPLQASVVLAIHDLALFEAMVADIYDLRGEADLNIAVSGTLAQPRLNGQAQLRNGSLRIPRLGLNIDQINLNGQSNGMDSLSFNLGARSGGGNLTVDGKTTLDRSAGWPTQININGKEFEVSRIPEARVLLTPDLQVRLHNRKIDISGEVHIPYAKLQPKDITTAARVSADAVIVDGEQTAVDNWAITSKIRLTLSERVSFYGFGFEGRFGGSLLLQDQPGQLTAATGEITIPEGRYRAYGQRLEVEHGRLLYTGGPLSNPGLDFRAVRKVNNVTAGLKIGGSLDQPQIDLFSIPAMGQTDTLAYLLLGRPIEGSSDEEGAMMAKAVLALGLSGGDRLARTLGNRFGLDEMRVESSDGGDQASLVMGRYLSPKLYISYGVGLIEAINTFNVRYQISDRLLLKGESGEHQGADFLYTIER